ncbi:hypothetical protein WJX77_001664 [Trebouxia sp. C0004]
MHGLGNWQWDRANKEPMFAIQMRLRAFYSTGAHFGIVNVAPSNHACRKGTQIEKLALLQMLRSRPCGPCRLGGSF